MGTVTVTVTDSTVPVPALPLTGAGLLALLLSAAAWGRFRRSDEQE
jgi:hypothetical protein